MAKTFNVLNIKYLYMQSIPVYKTMSILDVSSTLHLDYASMLTEIKVFFISTLKLYPTVEVYGGVIVFYAPIKILCHLH